MTQAYPGQRVLAKEARLTPEVPNVDFFEMFTHEAILRSLVGFNPLKISLKMLGDSLGAGRFALERAATPFPLFTHAGASFLAYERSGKGGKIQQLSGAASQSNAIGGLDWLATGFTILGDTSLFSGNKITMGAQGCLADFVVHSTTGELVNPVFRLRRFYNTAVAAEVVAVGDTSTTHFAFTAANAPICPNSVKINFTDSVGAKTGKIRDNGKGLLVNIPTDIVLDPTKIGTINYDTGDVVLDFSSAHIPTATNITMDYEHSTLGADNSDCLVSWEVNEI